jgi:exodeoxyribonuclease VII small subunit
VLSTILTPEEEPMAQRKFEDAMERLEGIVKDLDGGELSLEESLKVFEEGMKLIKFCTEKLDEAEQKITKLVKESDGEYKHQPFDIEDED